MPLAESGGQPACTVSRPHHTSHSGCTHTPQASTQSTHTTRPSCESCPWPANCPNRRAVLCAGVKLPGSVPMMMMPHGRAIMEGGWGGQDHGSPTTLTARAHLMNQVYVVLACTALQIMQPNCEPCPCRPGCRSFPERRLWVQRRSPTTACAWNMLAAEWAAAGSWRESRVVFGLSEAA